MKLNEGKTSKLDAQLLDMKKTLKTIFSRISAAVFFCAVCFVMFAQSGFSQDIKSRFGVDTTLYYKVYFNAIDSGYIKWDYLGREQVNGTAVDVLAIDSNTNILAVLDLNSKEKIFLDAKTHLPLRVERNLVVFGGKEVIAEEYDQQTGQVKITKTAKGKTSEQIIKQDVPIHNILDIVYFFPAGQDLSPGKVFSYNLPTQKSQVTVHPDRQIKIGKDKVTAYFVTGRGARKFNLWLDKRNLTPLRVEFYVLAGKISILRDLSPKPSAAKPK